ncbi:hypothetical protein [Nocardioides sp. CER19]|uniref:hypothetical protein n=1 Tax=Nocardioides sp. CER19 TaxID=3038538 RepID=UPI0024474569|nr:hypothetical protein [Nocardioides sp. CER19]MDH2413877.1 hypothetical protein [Nocardioides sp. CER19]
MRHRLTSAGERAYADGAGIVEGVLSETIGQLSEQERSTLFALLVKAANGADVG